MSRNALFGLILICLMANLGMANKSPAQSIKEVEVTISASQSNIGELFSKIEEQSPFHFLYNDQLMQTVSHQFTLEEKKRTIAQVLQEIGRQTGLGFRQINHTVTVDFDNLINDQTTKPASRATGIIKGRIVDFQTLETLPGANVMLVGTQHGTSSDADGYYRLDEVPEGEYELKISFIGYEPYTEQIEIKAGREITRDVKLQETVGALSEVVVSAIRRMQQPVQHTLEVAMLGEIKQGSSIASGISSEQIGKLADVNAAQVAKRVSGVTVADEQFLVVRGMNQRYNATYLDDNLAPSTEQYSRAFALDLIPSRVIDKMMVYKSPQPDLFGDFAGGAVKIDIKDALAVKHFDVGVRVGYLPVSTFSDINSYKGGETDWLGFDDGSRKLPGAVPGFGNFQKAQLSPKEYVDAFNPELTYGTTQASPDMQLTLNYYDAFKIGGTMLYNVTAFAYGHKTRFNDIYRQQGNTLTEFNAKFNNSLTDETRSIETGQLNLMQNFTLKLNDDNQFYFKNFILQKGQNSTQVRISRPNDGSPTAGFEKNNILGFNSRLLYTGNFGGNHISNNKKQVIDWNLGYTSTKYELPDQRVINFVSGSNSLEEDYSSLNWVAAVRRDETASRRKGIISRLFLDSREKLYNGSADYTYSFTPEFDIKIGTYNFWKEREVFRRIYVVHDAMFTSLGDFANRSYLPGQNSDVTSCYARRTW